jgi:hypothetical protein
VFQVLLGLVAKAVTISCNSGRKSVLCYSFGRFRSTASSADDGGSTIGRIIEQMACALQHGIMSAVRQMESSVDQSNDDDNMEEPVQLESL